MHKIIIALLLTTLPLAAGASVVREGRFRLIETAAERVAERLLADHPVGWLQLEVRKPITDEQHKVLFGQRAR